MRMSQHFGATLRAAPAEAEVASHQLLLRAGYIRQLASGIFSYLPLGLRAVRKIEAIIRSEMDAIGGQELLLPLVHPAELWQETGRWQEIGEEMARFRDRSGRDLLLAMTHEEVVADLARREIRSYRQLPQLLYQIQTKFRDEPRPRAGLIRVREFAMKDAYSLDADEAGLAAQYRNHYRAYFRIFSRAGLPDVVAVQSDTGMMGGTLAHEFMFLHPIGEDTLVLCDACGYAANLQVARFRKPDPIPGVPQALEKVSTPGATTISALAAFLNVPESHLAKVVFFVAAVPAVTDEEPSTTREVLVLALVRGDMEVSESKLAHAIRASSLKAASPEAIRAVGAEPGYGSPIGVAREGSLVVVDDLLAASANLVAGANEPGVHYRNVTPERDMEPDVVADLVAVPEGAPCAECGSPLRLTRGVEVGNIFQLGTRYTAAMGATYLDAEGRACPIYMGSYGIGIGRLLACLAEAHQDERGLKLPLSVAPYDLSLVRLGDASSEIVAQADTLYQGLRAAGIEVLYDDRDASPGVKFADADLIGLPLRATVSQRALGRGGIELKRREQDELEIVPLTEAVPRVRALLQQLQDIPFPDEV